MKKWLVLLFVVSYGGTMLYNAPASLLSPYVQQASQERLVLSDTSGTIWQGQATPVLHTPEQYLALPTLAWQIDLLSVFKGSLNIQLNWPDAPSSLIKIYPKQIEIQQISLNLPAQVLTELSPMLKPAQFSGELAIRSTQLSLANNQIQGNVNINWQNAGSPLSRVNPLGNYQIMLNGTGNTININLNTLSGVLQLAGQGSLQLGGGINFNGTAQAAPGEQDKVAELLHHIGPEISPGVRAIRVTP